jgi:hypothetical protein
MLPAIKLYEFAYDQEHNPPNRALHVAQPRRVTPPRAAKLEGPLIRNLADDSSDDSDDSDDNDDGDEDVIVHRLDEGGIRTIRTKPTALAPFSAKARPAHDANHDPDWIPNSKKGVKKRKAPPVIKEVTGEGAP